MVIELYMFVRLQRNIKRLNLELPKDVYYGLKLIKASYKSDTWVDFFKKLVQDTIGTKDYKTILKRSRQNVEI